MIARRPVIASMFAGCAATVAPRTARAAADDALFADGTASDLDFPPLAALDAKQNFGYKPPSAAEIAAAAKIVDETPKGPPPVDIARSFVERFSGKDPDAISQWPAPAAWNPLIVRFFDATAISRRRR